MKSKLQFKEVFIVAMLMFGLFFGAGNLIFPVMLGHEAGQNLWPAALGFILMGATLPVIGIASAALSKSRDMIDMASPVCKGYALFYSIALYIAIGPAFAIPRNATVSFEIGIRPFLGGMDTTWFLAGFSAIFFLGVLLLSLKPANIMKYVGRYLTPAFLAFLAILLVVVFFNPVGSHNFAANAPYNVSPVTVGALDGYNTMDALASVIFCLIIIEAIQRLGVTEPVAIAKETFKAGVLCIAAMGAIYAALAYMGATSRNIAESVDTGAQIFAIMSGHYFGEYGQLLLAIIVTLACFKTCIGLVTAGAEFFNRIYAGISIRTYIYALTLISFAVANVGLSAIITGAIPVLFFLYPLTITMIALALLYPWIGKSPVIYRTTIGATFLVSTFDFVKYCPSVVSQADWAQAYIGFAMQNIPLYEFGFGWVIPALIGLTVGVVLKATKVAK